MRMATLTAPESKIYPGSLVLLLAFLVLMAGFGCIEEKLQVSKNEQIGSTATFDIDRDGKSDYIVYEFAPFENGQTGKTTERQVIAVMKRTGMYTSLRQLGEEDLTQINSDIREAIKEKDSADLSCSQNLGIATLPCVDTYACSKLCSAHSTLCRGIAESHSDVLGGAIVDYVEERGKLVTSMESAKAFVPKLGNATNEQKYEYLNDITAALFRIALINANPVYSLDEVELCTNDDAGAQNLRKTAQAVGDYKLEETEYYYIVTVRVKDLAKPEFGAELENIELEDKVPQNAENVYSHQGISITKTPGTTINWAEKRPTDGTYLLTYSFASATPPEEITKQYMTPEVTVKQVNADGLKPVNGIFILMLGVTKNYYIALGLSLGIVLVLLSIAYTLAMVAIGVLRAVMAKKPMSFGIRKTFRRVGISWKTDGLVALVMIAIGIYGANTTLQPQNVQSLLDMSAIEFMLTQWWGVAAAFGIMTGTHLVYLAIENILKIMILERVHGEAIKEEKQQFADLVQQLKQKLSELRIAVERAAAEEFDVGNEYDLLTRMNDDRIEKMAEKETPKSRRAIEDSLTEVESATGNLAEKKKVADQNWQKWNEMMNQMVEEKKEIYANSLVTIPASLRQWALRKYAKENSGRGMVMENDVVKTTVIAPERVVETLLSMKLIDGVVVLKGEKVLISKMAEGSGTVPGVLAVKLKQYIFSLAKNLGQHEPVSFAGIGNKMVLVFMRGKNIESVLLIRRERFNEAIETWKTKSAAFDN